MRRWFITSITICAVFGLVVPTCFAAKARIKLVDREVVLSANRMESTPGSLYSLDGNAKLVNSYTSKGVTPGTMRIDAMDAGSIDLRTSRDAKGKEMPAKASATGGVKIWGKRSEKKDGAGFSVQDVYATARQATFDQAQGMVVLTGSVYVKITEPGQQEPVMDMEADKLTFDTKANKIILGDAGQPGKVTVTEKKP